MLHGGGSNVVAERLVTRQALFSGPVNVPTLADARVTAPMRVGDLAWDAATHQLLYATGHPGSAPAWQTVVVPTISAITVLDDTPVLPNSRRLVSNASVAVLDNGAGNTVELSVRAASPSAMTFVADAANADATLDASAMLRNTIVTYSGFTKNRTRTLPTVASLLAADALLVTGTSYPLYWYNTSKHKLGVAANSGWTLAGCADAPQRAQSSVTHIVHITNAELQTATLIMGR